jgi:transcription initiation factor TFIIE subunit alpha
MKIPLEMVHELILEIVGQDGINLINLIFNKKNVSEFKIADKLGITVNKVRNILYRMGEYNLVDFTRKKDKKKGMYIYYWTFDNRKALELIINMKKKKLAELRDILKEDREVVRFKSPADGTIYNYAQALELGFRCPDSNDILEEIKPELTDHQAKEEMKKIREELNSKILQQPLIPVVEEPKKEKVKRTVKKKTVKEKIKKIVKKKVLKKKAVKKLPKKEAKGKKVSKKKTKKVVKKKSVSVKIAKPKKRGLLRRIFRRKT